MRVATMEPRSRNEVRAAVNASVVLARSPQGESHALSSSSVIHAAVSAQLFGQNEISVLSAVAADLANGVHTTPRAQRGVTASELALQSGSTARLQSARSAFIETSRALAAVCLLQSPSRPLDALSLLDAADRCLNGASTSTSIRLPRELRPASSVDGALALPHAPGRHVSAVKSADRSHFIVEYAMISCFALHHCGGGSQSPAGSAVVTTAGRRLIWLASPPPVSSTSKTGRPVTTATISTRKVASDVLAEVRRLSSSSATGFSSFAGNNSGGGISRVGERLAVMAGCIDLLTAAGDGSGAAEPDAAHDDRIYDSPGRAHHRERHHQDQRSHLIQRGSPPSPQLWELCGHMSLAAGDYRGARSFFEMAGHCAYPSLMHLLLVTGHIDAAVALAAKCMRAVDALRPPASAPHSTAHAQDGNDDGISTTDNGIDGDAEHHSAFLAATLPHRLACWLAGHVISAYYCSGGGGGRRYSSDAYNDGINSSAAAIGESDAAHQSGITLPSCIDLSSTTSTAASHGGSLGALLRNSVATSNVALSPLALQSSSSHVEEWTPSFGLRLLLTAAGAPAALNVELGDGAYTPRHHHHVQQQQYHDSFISTCVQEAAHLAVHSSCRVRMINVEKDGDGAGHRHDNEPVATSTMVLTIGLLHSDAAADVSASSTMWLLDHHSPHGSNGNAHVSSPPNDTHQDWEGNRQLIAFLAASSLPSSSPMSGVAVSSLYTALRLRGMAAVRHGDRRALNGVLEAGRMHLPHIYTTDALSAHHHHHLHSSSHAGSKQPQQAQIQHGFTSLCTDLLQTASAMTGIACEGVLRLGLRGRAVEEADQEEEGVDGGELGVTSAARSASRGISTGSGRRMNHQHRRYHHQPDATFSSVTTAGATTIAASSPAERRLHATGIVTSPAYAASVPSIASSSSLSSPIRSTGAHGGWVRGGSDRPHHQRHRHWSGSATTNHWIPVRMKLLAAMAAARSREGGDGAGTMAAVASLPPTALCPSPHDAAALPPDQLQSLLNRIVCDYPCLPLFAEGGCGCGDAPVRRYVRRLVLGVQVAGDQAVDAVAGGGDGDNADLSSHRSPPSSMVSPAINRGPSHRDAAVATLHSSICVMMDCARHLIGTTTAGTASNPTDGSNGGVDAAAFWLPVCDIITTGTSGANTAPPNGDGVDDGANHTVFLRAAASGIWTAVVSLWCSHLVDVASAVSTMAFSGHGIAATLVGMGSSGGSSTAVEYALASSMASVVARYITAATALVPATHEQDYASDGSGDDSALSSAVTACCRLLHSTASSSPSIAARPIVVTLPPPSTLTARLRGDARSTVAAARACIAGAPPLRVSDPAGMLPFILAAADSAHVPDPSVSTSEVGLPSTTTTSSSSLHPSFIPPSMASILPILRRDGGFRDFTRCFTCLLCTGVLYSQQTHRQPTYVQVIIQQQQDQQQQEHESGGGQPAEAAFAPATTSAPGIAAGSTGVSLSPAAQPSARATTGTSVTNIIAAPVLAQPPPPPPPQLTSPPTAKPALGSVGVSRHAHVPVVLAPGTGGALALAAAMPVPVPSLPSAAPGADADDDGGEAPFSIEAIVREQVAAATKQRVQQMMMMAQGQHSHQKQSPGRVSVGATSASPLSPGATTLFSAPASVVKPMRAALSLQDVLQDHNTAAVSAKYTGFEGSGRAGDDDDADDVSDDCDALLSPAPYEPSEVRVSLVSLAPPGTGSGDVNPGHDPTGGSGGLKPAGGSAHSTTTIRSSSVAGLQMLIVPRPAEQGGEGFSAHAQQRSFNEQDADHDAEANGTDDDFASASPPPVPHRTLLRLAPTGSSLTSSTAADASASGASQPSPSATRAVVSTTRQLQLLPSMAALPLLPFTITRSMSAELDNNAMPSSARSMSAAPTPGAHLGLQHLPATLIVTPPAAADASAVERHRRRSRPREVDHAYDELKLQVTRVSSGHDRSRLHNDRAQGGTDDHSHNAALAAHHTKVMLVSPTKSPTAAADSSSNANGSAVNATMTLALSASTINQSNAGNGTAITRGVDGTLLQVSDVTGSAIGTTTVIEEEASAAGHSQTSVLQHSAAIGVDVAATTTRAGEGVQAPVSAAPEPPSLPPPPTVDDIVAAVTRTASAGAGAAPSAAPFASCSSSFTSSSSASASMAASSFKATSNTLPANTAPLVAPFPISSPSSSSSASAAAYMMTADLGPDFALQLAADYAKRGDWAALRAIGALPVPPLTSSSLAASQSSSLAAATMNAAGGSSSGSSRDMISSFAATIAATTPFVPPPPMVPAQLLQQHHVPPSGLSSSIRKQASTGSSSSLHQQALSASSSSAAAAASAAPPLPPDNPEHQPQQRLRHPDRLHVLSASTAGGSSSSSAEDGDGALTTRSAATANARLVAIHGMSMTFDIDEHEDADYYRLQVASGAARTVGVRDDRHHLLAGDLHMGEEKQAQGPGYSTSIAGRGQGNQASSAASSRAATTGTEIGMTDLTSAAGDAHADDDSQETEAIATATAAAIASRPQPAIHMPPLTTLAPASASASTSAMSSSSWMTSALDRVKVQMSILAAQTDALSRQAEGMERDMSAQVAVLDARQLGDVMAVRGARLTQLREQADVLLAQTTRDVCAIAPSAT